MKFRALQINYQSEARLRYTQSGKYETVKIQIQVGLYEQPIKPAVSTNTSTNNNDLSLINVSSIVKSAKRDASNFTNVLQVNGTRKKETPTEASSIHFQIIHQEQYTQNLAIEMNLIQKACSHIKNTDILIFVMDRILADSIFKRLANEPWYNDALIRRSSRLKLLPMFECSDLFVAQGQFEQTLSLYHNNDSKHVLCDSELGVSCQEASIAKTDKATDLNILQSSYLLEEQRPNVTWLWQALQFVAILIQNYNVATDSNSIWQPRRSKLLPSDNDRPCKRQRNENLQVLGNYFPIFNQAYELTDSKSDVLKKQNHSYDCKVDRDSFDTDIMTVNNKETKPTNSLKKLSKSKKRKNKKHREKCKRVKSHPENISTNLVSDVQKPSNVLSISDVTATQTIQRAIFPRAPRQNENAYKGTHNELDMVRDKLNKKAVEYRKLYTKTNYQNTSFPSAMPDGKNCRVMEMQIRNNNHSVRNHQQQQEILYESDRQIIQSHQKSEPSAQQYHIQVIPWIQSKGIETKILSTSDEFYKTNHQVDQYLDKSTQLGIGYSIFNPHSVNINRSGGTTVQDELPSVKILCSERFLESYSQVVASLASGKFDSDDQGNSTHRSKIDIVDSPLLNVNGIDIETSDRSGFLIVSDMQLQSVVQAKQQILKIAELAAIGQYAKIYVVIYFHAKPLNNVTKHLVKLQFAATTLTKTYRSKILCKTTTHKSLASSLAQTILRISSAKICHESLGEIRNDMMLDRLHFLLTLIPMLNVGGAIRCLDLSKKFLPVGSPYFEMLFKNQRLRRKIMLTIMSNDVIDTLNPAALVQLSRALNVNTNRNN